MADKGGGDSGGFGGGSTDTGKGGGSSSGAGKGAGDSGSGASMDSYSPPADLASDPAMSYAGPTGTSPGEQAGFMGAGLPSEITSGASDGASSGGYDWSGPNISDYTSGAPDSWNLSGPGPVGGDSGLPGAGGGTNTFVGSDTAAPSATAFAAPSGVTGTSDLTSLVSGPSDSSAASMTPEQTDMFGQKLGAAYDAQIADPSGDKLINPNGETTLPAAASSSGSGSGDKSLMDTLGVKPNLGTALAGAGLLNNLINRPSSGNVAGMNSAAASANAVAGQQNEAGVALQQYLKTGTLPQGYEDQVQQGVLAAKQRIISNAANRGLPTDPTMNSTLAQELAQVDNQIPSMRAALAKTLSDSGQTMINAGLQATGISSGVYNNLATLENQQNKARADAIANFAASLNGGTKPGTINLKVA